MLRQTLAILLLITLFGCGKFDEPSPQNAIPQATNIAIADLRKLVADRSLLIEEPLVIGGYVTSSDKASNFHKTFVIEDATAGAEVMAGLYDLHNIYPEGYYVTIDLKGCCIAQNYGVLQIGMRAESYSYYPTEYFSSRILLDKHITRYDVRNPVAPKPAAINELHQSDCGRLFCIGNLSNVNSQYTATVPLNQTGTWQGYNLFTDKNGVLIAVYTSDYANYAKELLPDSDVAITGILQYGELGSEEMFMLKMRDINDCKTRN